MESKSTPSQVLAEIMTASLSKNPELAAKQRRLLEKISSASNQPQPSDSTGSAKDDVTGASASSDPMQSGVNALEAWHLEQDRLFRVATSSELSSKDDPTDKD